MNMGFTRRKIFDLQVDKYGGLRCYFLPLSSIVTKICGHNHQSSNLGHPGQCMQRENRQKKGEKKTVYFRNKLCGIEMIGQN